MKVYGDITLLWSELINRIYDLDRDPCEKFKDYDLFFQTKSCHFEFDLSSLGYTKTKWTSFLGRYVERDDMIRFIHQMNHKPLGEVALIMGKRTKHTNGPCVLGITARIKPLATLTLYSRTALIPTRGCLELGLISQVANHLESQIDVKFAFTWFCGSMSWWGLQFMPLLTSQKKMIKYMNDNYPFSKTIKKAIEDGSKFMMNKRLLDRVAQIDDGLIPSLEVRNLPFIWRDDNDNKQRIDLKGDIYRPGKYPSDFKLTPGMLPYLKKRREAK